MSEHSREFLLDRICSGKTAISVNGKIYFYSLPSASLKYQGAVLEREIIENNEPNLLTRSDMLFFLKEMGKWEDKFEREIQVDIPKVIDILKVDIYNTMKLDERGLPPYLAKMERVKDRLKELLSLKYMFDEYTIENHANKEKYLFFLSYNVKPRTEPNKLLNPLLNLSISETEIRELARSGMWSFKWNALKRGMKVFSKRLTDDQEQLIRWSTVYENIYEAQDCPSSSIINFDDAFDGYLISRQKQSDRDHALNEIDKMIGDKGNGVAEVYLPARSREHAREINSLNTPEAIAAKQKKFAQIAEQGFVKNSDLTDERVKLNLAKNILASRNH